jgi:Fe-S-cluster containining protein
MMEDRARARLRVHLQLIDGDVAPVVDRYRAHIECRPGCSDCCHQTFRVTEIEGAYLREGLAALPAAERDDIVQRARSYAPDARHPCPALDGAGRCRLYAHRPRICRKYGIPLWHPDRPHEVTTCPKNFRDATDVDADLILDPQAQWARDWIRLREELDLREASRTTIAEQLLIPTSA